MVQFPSRFTIRVVMRFLFLITVFMLSNPVSADAVRQTEGDFYDAFRQLDQTGEFATSISLLEGLLLAADSTGQRNTLVNTHYSRQS
jgi:hypothetical protein